MTRLSTHCGDRRPKSAKARNLSAGVIFSLLSLRLGTLASALICSVLMLIAMLVAWPRLLRLAQAQDGALFVLPRGIVLLLAVLAALGQIGLPTALETTCSDCDHRQRQSASSNPPAKSQKNHIIDGRFHTAWTRFGHACRVRTALANCYLELRM
jgi:hypothetical protein